MQQIQIKLPADLHYSSMLRHMADELFVMLKFSKAWCSRLKLVVDELFMNAVRYGSTPDSSMVTITFVVDENGIECVMEDDGTGALAVSVEELKKRIQQNEANTDITRTSGRGLSMITKLWTDGMEISQSEFGGIAVKIYKKLETAKEAPPAPPPPPELAEAIKAVKAAVGAPVTQGAPAAVRSDALATPPTGVPQTAVTPPSEAAGPLVSPVESQVAAPAVTAGPTPAAGAAYTVKLSGEIDQSNITEKVSPVYDQIEVIPNGSTLILDFEELDYINSTFIGNLAAWYSAIQAKNGELQLKNVNQPIREVLALVGLTSVLKIAYKE